MTREEAEQKAGSLWGMNAWVGTAEPENEDMATIYAVGCPGDPNISGTGYSWEEAFANATEACKDDGPC